MMFRWGPRRRRAQEIFEQALTSGYPKQLVLDKVHLFYTKEHGRAVELEFLEVLVERARLTEE